MLAESHTGLIAAVSGATVLVAMAVMAPVVLREPPVAEGRSVLRYPKIARGLLRAGAVLFAILVCAGLYFAVVDPDSKLRGALWFGVPLLLALGVASVAEQRVRLAFDDEGIGGQTAFRGQRRIRWADLETARWSGAAQWLHLRDRHGEVIRVSGWLPGFARLVGVLARQAPTPEVDRAIMQWRKTMAVFGVSDGTGKGTG